MVFVFRFCIEFIKNPQEDFEQNMMFNMGQWLSSPFIILGVLMLIISSRQKRPAPLPVHVHQKPAVKPQPLPEKKAAANHQQHHSIKPKKKKR
jgi:prolipoprotein diacylglyceryltransferase